MILVKYVNDYLSKLIETLPGFENSCSKEFYINWRKQIIIFFCFDVIQYTFYDDKGNEVKGSYDNENLEINTVNIKSFDWTNTPLDINIDVSNDISKGTYINNLMKIQDILLEFKEKVIENNDEIASSYLRSIKKYFDWNKKVQKHIREIRKKIDDYFSSCYEPDLNIMSENVKELNKLFNEFETEAVKFCKE